MNNGVTVSGQVTVSGNGATGERVTISERVTPYERATVSYRIYLMPLWLRIWHAITALLILILMITGISLHFANPDLPLVPFDLAYRSHAITGCILALCYSWFLTATLITGRWKQYIVYSDGSWADCKRQLRYLVVGVIRGEPTPFSPTPGGGFHPLQRLTYWAVMYLVMPAIVVTGVIFMWPEYVPETVLGFAGLMPVAVAHSLAGLIMVLFLLIHAYLGSTGASPGTLYRMMITGWHES